MRHPAGPVGPGEAGREPPRQQEQESEERYRVVAELTSDYAYAYRVESDGTLVPEWLTDSCTRVLGYTAAEITIRGLQHLIYRDDRPLIVEQARRVLQGAEVVAEYRVVTKAGEVRWIRNYARPLRDAATGRVARIYGAAQDITERRSAEEALRRALENEQRITDTLQRALLMVPPEDTFAGFDFRPLYVPALDEAAVSGDFYDAFRLGPDAAAFVVGDAAGKGLAAAVHTAEVKFTLRAFLREYPHPARALQRMNEILWEARRQEGHGEDALICLSVAVVETTTGEAVFSSAGAEWPLLFPASGGSREVSAGGLPLGADPHAEYHEDRRQLAPGDVALLATDGVAEARRGAADFFGTERIKQTALAALPGHSAQEIGQAVLDAARAFAGGRLQDDACLLVLRRQGETPPAGVPAPRRRKRAARGE